MSFGVRSPVEGAHEVKFKIAMHLIWIAVLLYCEASLGLSEVSSPLCELKWKERFFIQGFRDDWNSYGVCSRDKIWWYHELEVPAFSESYAHSVYAKNDHGEITFRFRPDFAETMSILLYKDHQWPPKWMPPDNVYWNAGAGDWVYLKSNDQRDMMEESRQQEILLLWLKYEDIEKGITWNATLDFSQLSQIFDLVNGRLGHVISILLDTLNLHSD